MRMQAWIQVESSAGFLEVRLTLYLYGTHCAQSSPVRDSGTTVTRRGSVFLSGHDPVYGLDSWQCYRCRRAAESGPPTDPESVAGLGLSHDIAGSTESWAPRSPEDSYA